MSLGGGNLELDLQFLELDGSVADRAVGIIDHVVDRPDKRDELPVQGDWRETAGSIELSQLPLELYTGVTKGHRRQQRAGRRQDNQRCARIERNVRIIDASKEGCFLNKAGQPACQEQDRKTC